MFWWLKSKKKLEEEKEELLDQVGVARAKTESFARMYRQALLDNVKTATELAKAIKEPQTIILIDKRRKS